MTFKGISRIFSLKNEDQYNTIGAFWDEMSEIYGLESLIGLGYKWDGGKIYYAIGLKNGDIYDFNFVTELPDDGWETVIGMTDYLKKIYDEIYTKGPLLMEIEAFFNNGKCEIKYIRNNKDSNLCQRVELI